MNFLTQLLGQAMSQPTSKPRAGKAPAPRYTPPQRLMQVNPDGSHGPSNQGHLPPHLQKDTWLEGPQPRRRSITPGYEQQAAAYEQAMSSGNLNSPAVIGVDPKNFGYGPDMGARDTRPFKMYEDQSFQGDPRQFIQQNPGYRFYEDNTFSAPIPRNPYDREALYQPPVQQDPLSELRRFLGL